MTTIAQMAMKSIQAQKARAKAANPEATAKPIEGARQRVVSNTLGEITRSKTEDTNVVNLFANGEQIGEAIATYKTATQRKWTVTLQGVSVQNQHTINKGIRCILEEIELAPVVKRQTKRSV